MRKYLAAIAAVFAVLLAAACGSSGSSDEAAASSSSKGHNAEDVMFATMMIPHHRQAVEMADMLEGRSDVSAELLDLAAQIKKAQQPEIDKMTGWLESWGENVPGPDSPMGDHAGHAGMGGMMTDEQMSELAAASGADLEKMWLEMMIEHHEGAVDMAEMEKQHGEFAEAISMAEDIISSQQAEIEQMKKMLGQ